MKPSVRLAFTFGALLFVAWLNNVGCHPGTDSSTPDVPTAQRPTTVYFKKSLEQLKRMEESALKGWYDMVQQFLALIKPDNEILEVIIDYAQGTAVFDFPSSALELAQKNSVFLTMVSLGLTYVIAMLLCGLFFFCCRCMCNRCGAKETQRQTRNINCWRTMHKFCLILMIAFLVVPITSMVIINQHMKQSFPSIKSNASDIFPMLSSFANSTEADVNQMAKEQIHNLLDSVQDKENFEKGFSMPLEADISSAISSDSLEYVSDIVSWILKVREKYVPDAMERMDQMSTNVLNLENIVKNLTEETVRFKQHCSQAGSNICQIAIRKLSLEKLNVSRIKSDIDEGLDKLTSIDSDELRSLTSKIQNNSLLSDMIKEKSESLKNFADELKPKQDEILQRVKKEVKKYADMMREFANDGQHVVDVSLSKSEDYEQYRWWIMFGVATVLVIPVLFLIMGLICGCCGYRKGYHPSKRSATSNCGGLCLVLAVYYFFIIAWVLMLLTVALFIVGGNIQSFVCIPLYQDEFTVLDQVKSKLEITYPDLEHFVPSKFLSNCKEDKSVFEALDLSVLNKSSSAIIKAELEKSLRDDEIERNLRNGISRESAKIQQKLRAFSNALNISQVRDLPDMLTSALEEVRKNIEDTKQKVKTALSDNSSPDLENDLQLINKTALELWKTLNNFEEQLSNFTIIVSTVYNEASDYMEKVNIISKDLKALERKLPEFVHERLFQYVTTVVNTDLSEALLNVGQCEDLWIAFDTARTVVCDFIVYPVNGFWFSLGWSLVFIIPAIIFAIKLSRHYLRMKYDTDLYRHDEREAVPLDDMSRTKPFSYTNPGNMNWMPQNYMVHPTSSNHIRQFDYK